MYVCVCFVLQIGPGLVNLTLKSRFGTVLLIHSLTPQEPFLQKYCLQAFSDWWIPTFVIKMLVQGYDVQVSTTYKMLLCDWPCCHTLDSNETERSSFTRIVGY